MDVERGRLAAGAVERHHGLRVQVLILRVTCYRFGLPADEFGVPAQAEVRIAAALGREVPFAEISREEAHRPMAAFLEDEAADAVLDLTGGDVNDELLTVRDTVSRVTGLPARPFSQWVSENAAAFR